ncbi:MAG TPA: UvrD-helicase domain-containing protein, partial [Opitutaceae bacterium]|nr:UvrD-helicase domain-containing protein [Opitutaceae bacterium]
ALTFTRKAAGEFFDEILTRLADAASSEESAARLATKVKREAMRSADFGALLRRMVDAMPRLTLGTMDSFFAKVVSAFPLELGLSGEMRVIDVAEAAEETRRVMGRFFAVTRERGGAQDAVLEAFKLATMGVEAKSVTGILDRFIEEYFDLFRRTGDLAAWGNSQRIWPDGFPWGGGIDMAERDLMALREWLAEDGGSMGDMQLARWEDFAQALEVWSPGAHWPKPLDYMVRAVLKAGATFLVGGAPLTIERKKQTPPVAVRAAVARMVQRVIALELGRRMAVTQGIGALLQQFDAAYDSDVRRSGRLTFSDVLELLGASGIMAESDRDADARRSVDFRLDGRVDHWLLDEFQDTSRRQWDVLEGLIDEAVQDPTDSRSLFYVGDVKQAIFSWRGGDPRLFGHVAERYSKGGPRAIEARELNRSYRSGEAIIGLVNSVFGSVAIGDVFPGVAERWTKVWRQHESAVPERKGQAAVLIAVDEDARFRTMLELVRAIDPISRGFTCAVLVKKNDTATRVAEYLRREGGIAAVAESDLLIGKDNPWSAAFVSLVWCAAHPGDSVSWKHLMMTPAKSWLVSIGVTTHDELTRHVLRIVGENGFEALASAWLSGMKGSIAEGDAFTQGRAGQLIAAAREFDEAGGGSAAAFIRWIEAATVRESEGAEVVRVMTVHKSKGLGFDIVILPDLEGGGLASRRDGPAISMRDDGVVDWILEFPGKLIAEHDGRLGSYLEAAESDSAFESLALLYVAMTRAKRGLYAIVEPVGRSSACSYPRLLAGSLGLESREVEVGSARFTGVHETGDSSWLTDGLRPVALEPWKPAVVRTGRSVDRIPRKVASTQMDRERTIAELLASERDDSAAHGTAFHELISEVEWTDGLDVPQWAAAAKRRGFAASVVDAAAESLSAPGLAEVFRRPGEGWEVWRERAFEALLDDEWVSAVVDRVCIARGKSGEVRAVRLYEFKTGRAPDGAAVEDLPRGHALQLEANRRVLAAATGVPVEKVRAALAYTRRGLLVFARDSALPE